MVKRHTTQIRYCFFLLFFDTPPLRMFICVRLHTFYTTHVSFVQPFESLSLSALLLLFTLLFTFVCRPVHLRFSYRWIFILFSLLRLLLPLHHYRTPQMSSLRGISKSDRSKDGGDIELHSQQSAGSSTSFAENPDLPQVTIAYRDLTSTVKVSASSREIQTIISPLTKAAKSMASCCRSNKKMDFHRIKDASGVIFPGTMTLVLAPPGHGKSTYLKAISSRIPLTSGALSFNGYTPEEAEEEGVNVRKLTSYVDQTDCNSALLTVQETITFAHKTSSAFFNPKRVDDTISLLGLDECKDTYFGGPTVRGISGGQRRRVTLSEALVSDARALFLDEYTNGLDSATSEDITFGLRQWVQTTQGSIVTAIQQPTPGLYAMFDNVVLLRDSHVVYHGPREGVLPFIASMGFQAPGDVDVCDYLIDCLSHPRVIIRQQREGGGCSIHADISDKDRTMGDGRILQLSQAPCVSTQSMVRHYKNSIIWKEMSRHLDDLLGTEAQSRRRVPIAVTAKAKTMYEGSYALPIFDLYLLVWARQGRIFMRDKPMLFLRLLMCVVMGLIYSSLFYQIPKMDSFMRTAVFMIVVVQLAFVAMTEIPFAVASNVVVKRQVSAQLYPASAFVTSSYSSIPFVVLEIAIFGSIIYFMTGQTADAGRVFLFYFLMLLQSTMMVTFLRMISAFTDVASVAESLAAPIVGIFLIYSNYFIPMDSLRVWIRWLIWISPFSWTIRAMVISEYKAPRYDELVDGQRLGEYLLDSVGIYTDSAWIWYCVVYLVAYTIVLSIFHSYFLNRKYHELSIGTRRTPDEEHRDTEDLISEADEVQNTIGTKFKIGVDATNPQSEPSKTQSKITMATFQSKAPISPAWLSFKDVTYKVQVVKSKKTVDRVLLNNVFGYAEPGKLTALMGASGAGKTTLLDVLAGRKTSGRIEGAIKINGKTPTREEFASVTGYVEQFDSLLPFDTVYETLLFAARLRLPATLDDSTKQSMVDEVLEILELSSIRDLIIGNASIQGLSPSQLKRVNIGVELVSNPTILFLDEPTTGLDSHAAQVVMKAVRRIARSGRSIICTIHQPSAELFYLFDRLCLLGAGGHQIYFGNLGQRSRSFITYLSKAPGVKPIPYRHNPASWMLEELGVGIASVKSAKTETVAKREEISAENSIETPAEVIQKYCRYFRASKVYECFYTTTSNLDSMSTTTQSEMQTQEKALETSSTQCSEDPNDRILTDSEADMLIELPCAGVYSPDSMAVVTGDANVRPSRWIQLLLVTRRFYRSHYRNPGLVFSRLIILLLLSLVFGAVYWQLEMNTQMTVVSRMASYVISALFFGYVLGASTLSNMMDIREVFYRERASGYYPGFLWAVGALLLEWFYAIFFVFVTQIPFYFMSGMSDEAGKYFQYTIALYIYVLSFITNAIFFSNLAPNATLANMLQSMMMSFFFTFAGVAVFKPALPRGYRWLFAGIPLRHFNEMITMSQAKCENIPLCGPIITVPTENGDVFLPLSQMILDMVGFSFDYFWHAFGWAALYVAIVSIGAIGVYQFFNHSNK